MGAFDEMLERMVDEMAEDAARHVLQVHGPARAEVLLRAARAEAAERGWPLLAGVEWVMAFGAPYDVPKMLTGLRGLIAS